ncbi:N-acetyltransferase [Marinomonas agarivorans]|nr:N-acetyltransferase [Marinomonas agarivorans]
MYEFPFSLETKNLIIRPTAPQDYKIFHSAVVESYDELKEWLGWVKKDYTLAEAEKTCRESYGKYISNQDLMVLFIDKKSGELVGVSGLMKPNWDLRIFEVGYWCNTIYSSKGLMTEGLIELCKYAKANLDANRIYLTTDEKNVKSWKLAERVGFKYEGTLRKDRCDLNNNLRNTKIYSII